MTETTGHNPEVERFLRTLRASSEGVSPALLLGIQSLGDEMIEPLAQFLDEAPTWEVRLRCTEVLASHAHDNDIAYNAIIGRLNDRSYKVRRQACECLARLRRPGAADAIRPLLEHNDERTRQIADLALEYVEGDGSVIRSHRTCRKCSYDLYGRPRMSFCPECGAPVGTLRARRRKRKPQDMRLTAQGWDLRLQRHKRRLWATHGFAAVVTTAYIAGIALGMSMWFAIIAPVIVISSYVGIYHYWSTRRQIVRKRNMFRERLARSTRSDAQPADESD